MSRASNMFLVFLVPGNWLTATASCFMKLLLRRIVSNSSLLSIYAIHGINHKTERLC